MPGRDLPVISAEDSIAAERMTDLLTGMGFVVHQFRIPVDGAWEPAGDVVAICGPKSSRVTAAPAPGSEELLRAAAEGAGDTGAVHRPH
jgi:hypothetical protein